jgi:hypothetical protein
MKAKTQIIQNHENSYNLKIGQGEDQHKKCGRIKLDGGKAYHRKNEYNAVVTGVTFNRAN